MKVSSALVAATALVGETMAIVTTGQTRNGIQLRKEIRDVVNDKPAYNIYLLALQQLQSVDQGSVSSWYQVSGIHGRPQAPYDGVSGTSSPQGAGYCTHGSNYFPTWHRPYLALYEQLLTNTAISIANQFSGSQKTLYLNAANKLRSPYFDWAKHQRTSSWISAFSNPTVTVTTPSGTKTITNPLLRYNFHPNPGDLFFSPFVNWNTTLRWPSSNSSPNAADRESMARDNVNSWVSTLHDRVYNVLTTYSNYNQFSNEAWIQDFNTQDSLESVHDVFHGACGGTNYGHMSVIDVSAFDPMFWLHHTMVDRLFALWQALYPNNYFENQRQGSGSYWYNQGSISTSSTGLKPFKKNSSGQFWTSNDVRDWTRFYYTYPELQSGWTTSSVASAVNTLYGSGSSSTKRDVEDAREGNWLSMLKSRIPGKRATVTADSEGTNAHPRRYIANIKAQRNALGSSYFIFFFLGDISTSVDNFENDPNLVGVNPIISTTLTPKQVAAADPILVGATQPLNKALREKHRAGEIPSLKQKDVLPYLQKNLSWKVKTSGGEELDPSEIPNLLVSVGSAAVEPAAAYDKFPKLVGKPKLHTAVTTNKPAGVCIKEAGQFANVQVTTDL